MDFPFRRPEEILAHRSLQQILQSRQAALWTVGPADSVVKALQVMADKDINCVVVMEGPKLVGIVSERDCARRVVLARKSPEATPVSDIMVRDVITVAPTQTYAECLSLMHRHGIRHLPVVDKGSVTAVVSIRDLLSEAVAHHAKIIAELERERLEIFTSSV